MKTWLAMTAVCGLALSVYAGAADRPVLIACRGAGASQKLANDVCRGAESKPEGIRVVRQGERPDVRVTVSEPYRAEGAGRDAVAVDFKAGGLTGSVHLDSRIAGHRAGVYRHAVGRALRLFNAGPERR